MWLRVCHAPSPESQLYGSLAMKSSLTLLPHTNRNIVGLNEHLSMFLADDDGHNSRTSTLQMKIDRAETQSTLRRRKAM